MSGSGLRVQIDGRNVQVPAGSTLLDAAKRADVSIPTLCHRDGCRPGTSCMVCVVQVQGLKRLVPACAYPVRDGMVVETGTERVLQARRTAMELLLAEHVGDCEGPCRRGCPARMNIPLMLRQIAAGRIDRALVTVRREIPMPAVLGWVCPAPCEKHCRRTGVDAPVAICLAKRFAGEKGGRESGDWGMPPPRPGGRRVAVVGGGPAGLSCSLYLRLLGHTVELFEAGEQLGGGLCHSVGEGRLPKSVLVADIEAIRCTGVVMRTGVCVGVDKTLAELRERFAAVVLATGVHAEGPLPGPELARTPRGLEVEKGGFRTTMDGVFAAGSAVLPTRMAVRACADGKAAAFQCDGFLRQEAGAVPVPRFDSVIRRMEEQELREYAREADGHGRIQRAVSEAEGLSPDEAMREAGRCMHCDCRKAGDCRLRDLADQLGARGRRFKPAVRAAYSIERDHPDLLFESGKCIRCGLCIRISELRKEPAGLTFVGRGARTQVSPPTGVSWSGAILHAAAEIVEACPTGALSWKNDRVS